MVRSFHHHRILVVGVSALMDLLHAIKSLAIKLDVLTLAPLQENAVPSVMDVHIMERN